MILRPVRPTDAHQIATIHHTAYATAMPWLAVAHSEAEDQWFFKHRVLPNQSVQIANVDGITVGVIACESGWIEPLPISPPPIAIWHQGRALGIYVTCLACPQLWTFQRNTGAQLFYTWHGFVEVEHTDGTGNEEREPDVRMLWAA